MDGDHDRSFGRNIDYRIAVRMFESAFQACERLPDEDKQLLFREVAKRLLDQIPNNRSEEPTTEPTAVKILGIEIKQG